MYIKRQIVGAIQQYLREFPAVLVTGPRQVGKSTLLTEEFHDTEYVTMDDRVALRSFSGDPSSFLDLHGTPLILDEIQRAQEQFVDLKYAIDRKRSNGMFLLSGSQRYHLMQHVSDSLAGRIGILDMSGLSLREICGEHFQKPFLPDDKELGERKPKTRPGQKRLWEIIHRGSMPELYANPEMNAERFYASYVSTYVERDVRELSQIGDTQAYVQFMTALAARSGTLLNMHDIAKETGVDDKTIKKWLSILEASGIIYLLRPFSPNISKRLVKAPKVYFTDTGLLCYLCRWPTAESLQNGAQAGAVFETFVFNEIMKSYCNEGRKPELYFFRTTNGQEIDFLFYRDNKLYPLEVKKTASPNETDIRHFRHLQAAFPETNIGNGGLICMYDAVVPLANGHRVIPVTTI